jgi:hypothetical protein
MSNEDRLLRLLRSRAEVLLREQRGDSPSVDVDQLVVRVIKEYGQVIDISGTRRVLSERLRAALSELLASER